MKKTLKKNLVIMGIAIMTLCLATWIISNPKNETFADHSGNEVKSFDISEYREKITMFSVNNTFVESTSDPDSIMREAEKIWKVFFDQDTYHRIETTEKPYQVSYNREEHLWLVKGSIEPNKAGGAANIIIDKNTKKVVAIWHEK
jgi:hypothetical protein